MNASLQNLLLLANPTSHRIPSHLLLNCPTHLPLILKLSVIKSRSPQNLIRKDGLPQTYMPSTLAFPQNIGVLSKRYDPNTNLDSISQSSWWSDGTPCIRSKKALVLAQHLKDNVWNSLPLPDPIEEPLAPPQPNLDTPFTMFDLYRAFRRTKTGRPPAPDNLPMETLRLLPHPIKRILLSQYNDCLLSGTAPDHWKLSKVVMIYKGNQKNSRAPSSYRPSSLANPIYKVYACMLQQDLLIWLITSFIPINTVSSKDTPPLFISYSWSGPRLLTQSDIHLAASVRRYGILPLLVDAIMALYQNCQFFVTDPSGDSPYFPLARGIRRCSLSPYLFIIVPPP